MVSPELDVFCTWTPASKSRGFGLGPVGMLTASQAAGERPTVTRSSSVPLPPMEVAEAWNWVPKTLPNEVPLIGGE